MESIKLAIKNNLTLSFNDKQILYVMVEIYSKNPKLAKHEIIDKNFKGLSYILASVVLSGDISTAKYLISIGAYDEENICLKSAKDIHMQIFLIANL